MRKGSVISGAALATAVALMFLSSPMAADTSSSSAPAPQVKCLGGNACKGQSACKTAQSTCMGKNSCKGKGYVMTTSAEECTQKGGHSEKD